MRPPRCTPAAMEAGIRGLIGNDPALAGGVFNFGGTGTTLYRVKLGLEAREKVA